MRTRRILLVSLSTLSLGFAACGGGDEASTSTSATETSVAPTIPTEGVPVEAGELAMALDGVVAVGGDGRIYRPVPEASAEDASSSDVGGLVRPAIAPPRPPTGWTVAELPADGLARLYERAGELGLLEASIEPGADFDWCCDITASTLTIDVGGGTVEHVVPHVPVDDLPNGDDLALVERFMVELADVDAVGAAAPYVPEQWRIVAVHDTSGLDVRAWPLPDETDIGDCVVLPTDADVDTATGPYRAGGTSFAAEPLLPWEAC